MVLVSNEKCFGTSFVINLFLMLYWYHITVSSPTYMCVIYCVNQIHLQSDTHSSLLIVD